jgi:DNA polymerase-3 subunit gamma/tau
MPNLYQKYRPKTFEEIIGNEASIAALEKALTKKNHSHVYLLSGPAGTGKTTIARIAADKLGATEMDLREINSANARGIETAREIIQSIRYNPQGRAIVYILDEAHKWTNDFQNALLKPLEDTPEHVYFFICTTDPGKLIKAVKSRCTEIKTTALPIEKIVTILRRINKLEELSISKNVLETIAEKADGSPRNAIVMLEQISNADSEEAIEKILESKGSEEDLEVIELARALLNNKTTWKDIAIILKKLKENGKLDDAENIRYIVLGYMNAVIMNGSLMPRAVAALEAFAEPTYNTGKAGITLACLQTIS